MRSSSKGVLLGENIPSAKDMLHSEATVITRISGVTVDKMWAEGTRDVGSTNPLSWEPSTQSALGPGTLRSTALTCVS